METGHHRGPRSGRVVTEDLSLYFHIPLCARKCPYCHFYTVPNQKPFREALLEGLFLEWERIASYVRKKRVVSVYFGGGTPWLLGSEAIGSLLERISPVEWCEITLEANPEEVTLQEAGAFAQVGVNRLSLGVQALDDRLLERLGRRHTARRAIEALVAAYEGGIENLSIDLMYDIPTQTLKSLEESLMRLQELPLSHLSLYNLTFEPHTAFFKQKHTLQPLVPPGEESTLMLLKGIECFDQLGLERYEISAFAKQGRESRHNLGYWTARPFLGLGPSAFSYLNGKRFQNAPHLNHWLKKLRLGDSGRDFEERLSPPHDTQELLAIGLRVLSGVDLTLFSLTEDVKGTLSSLEEEGYLTLLGNRARLTDKGLLFYDTVAAEIVG